MNHTANTDGGPQVFIFRFNLLLCNMPQSLILHLKKHGYVGKAVAGSKVKLVQDGGVIAG